MPTLIVEDGTGVANANSYVTLAQVNDHVAIFTASAKPWIDATDDGKTAAVIQASSLLDRRLYRRLRGQMISPTQTMQFPRANVPIPGAGPSASLADSIDVTDVAYYPATTMPPLWIQAVCELAKRYAYEDPEAVAVETRTLSASMPGRSKSYAPREDELLAIFKREVFGRIRPFIEPHEIRLERAA